MPKPEEKVHPDDGAERTVSRSFRSRQEAPTPTHTKGSTFPIHRLYIYIRLQIADYRKRFRDFTSAPALYYLHRSLLIWPASRLLNFVELATNVAVLITLVAAAVKVKSFLVVFLVGTSICFGYYLWAWLFLHRMASFRFYRYFHFCCCEFDEKAPCFSWFGKLCSCCICGKDFVNKRCAFFYRRAVLDAQCALTRFKWKYLYFPLLYMLFGVLWYVSVDVKLSFKFLFSNLHDTRYLVWLERYKLTVGSLFSLCQLPFQNYLLMVVQFCFLLAFLDFSHSPFFLQLRQSKPPWYRNITVPPLPPMVYVDPVDDCDEIRSSRYSEWIRRCENSPAPTQHPTPAPLPEWKLVFQPELELNAALIKLSMVISVLCILKNIFLVRRCVIHRLLQYLMFVQSHRLANEHGMSALAYVGVTVSQFAFRPPAIADNHRNGRPVQQIAPAVYSAAVASGDLADLYFNAMLLSERDLQSVAAAAQRPDARVELLSLKGCEINQHLATSFARALAPPDDGLISEGMFRHLHTLNLEGNALGMGGKLALGRALLRQETAGKLEVFHVNEWKIERHMRVLGLSVHIPKAVRKRHEQEMEAERHLHAQMHTEKKRKPAKTPISIHRRPPLHQHEATCRHRLLPPDLVLIAGALHVCRHIDTVQLCGQPIHGVGWVHAGQLRRNFQAPVTSKFEKGDKIEADYKESGEWYPGTIAKEHAGGKYDIKYNDGDSEEMVEASRVRHEGAEATNAPAGGADEKDEDGEDSQYDWQGLRALVQVLVEDEHVTSLDLSCTELGGWNGVVRPGATYDVRGVRLIASALEASDKRQSLASIDLSHNAIQPKGLGVLAKALVRNYGLHRLSLDHNPLFALRQGLPPVTTKASKKAKKGRRRGEVEAAQVEGVASASLALSGDTQFLGDAIKWDTSGLDPLLDLLQNIQLGQQNLQYLDLRHTGFDVMGAEIFDYTNKFYFPTRLRTISEICERKNVTLVYDESADSTHGKLETSQRRKESSDNAITAGSVVASGGSDLD